MCSVMFRYRTLPATLAKIRAKPLLFRLLRAVRASSLLSVLDTGRVEDSADDLIAKVDVLYAATANKHHRVFLEVMSHTRDVGRDFHAV